jgi:RNA polymerase sigma-70 factor (ECF subfamily)
MLFAPNRAVAEEVVQEAWLGLLKGLDRFEGRSSLKTWLFRILANVARTRAVRESRSLPFSSLSRPLDDEPSVDPGRFLDSGHRWAGHWSSAPVRWDDVPEAVISLRDIEGWGSEEVCELLSISEVNQRVLLHRARSRVRAALETYLAAE